MDLAYYVDLSTIQLAEGEMSSWVHAMPVGKYQHPVYGEIDFSPEQLSAYATSVQKRVLGTVDPVIDYDHEMFTGVAAGWVKDAKAQLGTSAANDGLQLKVEWTPDAVKRILSKEYRYFSATFKDEWKDPTGKEHKNVVFGGALTNRPYMKNLVPINLSELSFGEPAKEEEVDKKRIAALLGLSETATEDEVVNKLGEQVASMLALQTTATQQTATLAQMQEELKKLKEPKPQPPSIGNELKQLAEVNPTVKALIDQVEQQNVQLSETHKVLRQVQVANKLRELDDSRVILTPRAKKLAESVLMKLPTELGDEFWELMHLMRNSTAAMVELGERAGGSARYSQAKDAKAQFNELSQKFMAERKLSYADAVEAVSRDYPELYEAYRQESFAFNA